LYSLFHLLFKEAASLNCLVSWSDFLDFIKSDIPDTAAFASRPFLCCSNVSYCALAWTFCATRFASAD
jgi:hypothetical protein